MSDSSAVQAPSTPRISVVVPVYNEAASIEKALRLLEAFVRMSHEILIVYDFDEDTTLPAVQPLLAEFPSVRFVKNDHGRGVVNALKTGFKVARGLYVCVYTGDCTDQADAIPKMVALMDEGYDLVSGTRYVKGGVKYGGPWLQTQLSRIGNLMFKRLTGIPLSDITYSFKVYRKGFFETCWPKYDAGWVISMDLAIQGAFQGKKMAEIPTMWVDRQLGESKFRLLKWLPIYLKLFVRGLSLRRLRRG